MDGPPRPGSTVHGNSHAPQRVQWHSKPQCGQREWVPSGITSGGFSPPSITGSGSSTLTMNTTTSAMPYALSLTITGTAGNITHTASTTLLVHLVAPASLTATATGNAGEVALSWPASVGA